MAQDYPMKVTIKEAVELLLAAAKPVGAELVDLDRARKRVLACDIKAAENIPPFDRSPLDGYAVRAGDTSRASAGEPSVLRVIEEVRAGVFPVKTVGAGDAVKILTGAPIPAGADAVIRYEDTEFTDQNVRIFQPLEQGSNIIKAGEDVRQGTVVMEQGAVLGPAQIGILAGLGYKRVNVYRRPVVRIVSTGDELVDVGEVPKPGQIRNSSAYMLQAFLQEWGLDAEIYGIAEDRKQQIRDAIEACAEEADCVITTGGASVGDYDFVLEAMKLLGAEILFWKVQMKPGMATIAARKNGRLFIGLSGNPSAAVAGLMVLCLPALRKMCGWRKYELPVGKVVLPDGFAKKSPCGRVLPGRLEFQNGRPCLMFQKCQGSGMLSPWNDCNLIGIVPKETGELGPGSVIDAYFL